MDENYKNINSNNKEDEDPTVILDKITGMPINIDLYQITDEDGN